MVDSLDAIWRAVQSQQPRQSADIYHKLSPGGFVSILKRRGGGGGGSGGACTTLRPSLALVEEVWKLSISSGISGDTIPVFGPSQLDEDPPPAPTISAATSLWLVIEWEPLVDSDGTGDDEVFWMESGGEEQSVEFVLSPTKPTENLPEVDPVSGDITNGTFAILWATITEVDGGGYQLNSPRCGSHQLEFCIPATLRVVWD